MNFVPEGFNQSSDEEDFIDFGYNAEIYDRDVRNYSHHLEYQKPLYYSSFTHKP